MMSKVRSAGSVIGVLILYYAAAALLMAMGLDSLTTTVALDIIIAILVVVWWKSNKEHRIVSCKIEGGFGALLCMFIAMFILGQFTGTMVESWFGPGAFGHYQTTMQSNAVVALLLSLIVAPIAEECLVRGFIYQQFRRGWGTWVAWISQAVVFALMHGTLVHAVPTFLTALFLGLVYERTGDLRWPIAFHVIYNLSAMLFSGVNVPDVLCTPWVDIPLDIICVAVMAVMYANIMNKKVVAVVRHVAKPLGVAQLAVRPAEKREEEHYVPQENQEEEND